MLKQIGERMRRASRKFSAFQGDKRFTFEIAVITSKPVDGLIHFEVKSPSGAGWLYSDTSYFFIEEDNQFLGAPMVGVKRMVEDLARTKPKKVVTSPEPYSVFKVDDFTYFCVPVEDIKSITDLSL